MLHIQQPIQAYDFHFLHVQAPHTVSYNFKKVSRDRFLHIEVEHVSRCLTAGLW